MDIFFMDKLDVYQRDNKLIYVIYPIAKNKWSFPKDYGLFNKNG